MLSWLSCSCRWQWLQQSFQISDHFPEAFDNKDLIYKHKKEFLGGRVPVESFQCLPLLSCAQIRRRAPALGPTSRLLCEWRAGFDLSPINKYKKGFFSRWEQSGFQVTMSFPHESLWKPNSLLLFPLNEKACFPASRKGNSLISYSSPWLLNNGGSLLILMWGTEISAMLKQTPQAISQLLQNNLLEKKWKPFFFPSENGAVMWKQRYRTQLSSHVFHQPLLVDKVFPPTHYLPSCLPDAQEFQRTLSWTWRCLRSGWSFLRTWFPS